MALHVGATRGGAIASINVTPMADVIIVLLIIFMVTVPRLTRPVDLPDARSGSQRTEGPIVVTLSADGSIRLAEHGIVPLPQLTTLIRGRLGTERGAITVNADERLSYDQVGEVLTACRNAGAEEVALMTEARP